MNSAEKMFKELGYYFYSDELCVEYIIDNWKDIVFWKIDRTISIYNYQEVNGIIEECNRELSIKELNAINKQVEELGWIE